MSERLEIDRTYDDSIVAGIHETRHKILARFGNDIEAYMAFVASRRIPGVKYVDTCRDAKTDFAYPRITPDVPCDCESAD